MSSDAPTTRPVAAGEPAGGVRRIGAWNRPPCPA